jgi:hypothetical protein
LSATFTPKEVGVDGGELSVKATAPGTYAGAEIAPGDVPVEWQEGVSTSVPKLEVSDVSVDDDGNFSLTVTGPAATLSAAISEGKNAYTIRLTADADGNVSGKIDTKKFGKTKATSKFKVEVTAKWGEKKISKSATWP